jgi:hypothetical protein
MTQFPVQIKVRCVSCKTKFRLSEEQYREMLKLSRVELLCPHCGNNFEYTPLTAGVAANPPARSRAHRPEAEVIPEPEPAPPAPMDPPLATPVSARDFPPPPFAPLGGGAPAANVPPPPFAPLGGVPFSPAPAASFPQAAPTPSAGEAKKLTLNERWKQLSPAKQWTVIGVIVVVLAAIIFALPTGSAPETAAPKATEQPAPKAQKKADESEKPETKKGRAGDKKKAAKKADEDDKDSEGR